MRTELSLVAVLTIAALTVNGETQSTRISAPPDLPQMVRWTDPTERAFTVSVPAGWRISGGTHRAVPVQARNYVDAVSPDGRIRVQIDDPEILPRQEPHPLYYRMGWYEGRTVNGQMGPLTIERFKTGVQFAREYTAQKVCRAPETLAAFDLPAESQRMNAQIAPIAARAGAREIASAGEFVYRCGNQSGYTSVITVGGYSIATPQGPHVWGVEKLAGYIADRSMVDIARYVMNTMVATFKVDPAWQARYDGQVQSTASELMEASNRIAQTSVQMAQASMDQNMRMIQQRQKMFDQMNNGIMSSYKRQQESQDALRQRWSDITLGQIHGCDDLGNCRTVSNDYQYYWTKDGRTVVGGPSDGSRPNNDPQYRKWTPDY